MDVPVEDVKWLRDMIEDKMYVAREATGKSIWPYYTKTLPSEGTVSDLNYLLELRANLRIITSFYYDLDIDAPVSFIPSNYYSRESKLFQQAFGKDTWSNPDPKCITKLDLDELEQAIRRLVWILILTPPSSKLSVQTIKEKTWNIAGRVPSGENIVCDSSAQSCSETTYKDNVCFVTNLGSSYPSSVRGSSAMVKEKIYEKCSISSLNFPYELKGAKLLIRINYNEPNFPIFEPITPVIDVAGNSFTYNTKVIYETNPYTYSIEGERFNLAELDFNFDEDSGWSKINNFEIKPSEQDVNPVIIEGSRSAKGFLGRVEGVFVTPYEILKVELKVDKEYLEKKKLDFNDYNKVNSDGNLVITEYDELNCNILAEKITTADFRIIDNHEKVLAEKKGVSCNNDKCEYVFRVGKGVKNWPRGEIKYNSDSTKLKCQVEVDDKKYMSNDVVVAKHIYTFIHSDKSNVNNAKEQFDYFIKLSALKHNKVKPIYYSNRYRCFISEEKISKDIEKCFKELYRNYNYKYDRIIGLADDSVFDSRVQHVILIDDNLKSLAHEIGHSYNLADEYNYDAYSSIKNPLNPYPKCTFDNPKISEEKRLEGNNCWDNTKDFVDFCYSAGMPLPNGYETKEDLAKPYRSIMGKYDISSYEIEHKYPPEACYPLTTKDCGEIKVYSDCPLGACERGEQIGFREPYVEGESVIFNNYKHKERRSIVHLTDTNLYKVYPCSAYRQIKELKTALKGIKPDGGKFKGQINVDYTQCDESFCPVEWTTFEYDKKKSDVENAFKIEETIKGEGKISHYEGFGIIPQKLPLPEGRFYVKDSNGKEAYFGMNFVVCPKPDDAGLAKLWDVDLKLKADGHIRVGWFIFKAATGNYYKIDGTGKLELLMNVNQDEKCGLLSGRIVQNSKANWAICQYMYDDFVIGTSGASESALLKVSNEEDRKKLKILLDKILLKRCNDMKKGYNERDGGKTDDFNIEIYIEPAKEKDKQILTLKDVSDEKEPNGDFIVIDKKTVYEFLSVKKVSDKPEMYFFDEGYLNCCKPGGWERSIPIG